VNRGHAALRRSQAGGYAAPADRPRARRSGEQAGSQALTRAMMHGVEVREQPDGDGTVGFRTYASVTEVPYQMWDMFGPYTETIAGDAFGPTLTAQPDVAFLLNHGGMTLARTTSGTLTLGVDDTGLWYEPRLDPQNSVVRDVLSGVRRGDLNESSFAFRITRGSWDPSYTAYRIEQVDLHRGDVSVVNYGANPTTGDHGITLGTELDVDALDEDTARSLAGRLEQRLAGAARSAARAGSDEVGQAAGMARAELDALVELAAPHPLASRVRN
jgi:Escherichia/Staphylococcus phage prohead protease